MSGKSETEEWSDGKAGDVVLKNQEENGKPNADSKAETGEELTLEQAFERLDKLVERLEDREVPLEESFQIYKEGMELLKQCSEKIDTVEKKMQQISENGELREF